MPQSLHSHQFDHGILSSPRYPRVDRLKIDRRRYVVEVLRSRRKEPVLELFGNNVDVRAPSAEMSEDY